ncbi:MAG: hypothetical protein ACLQNV_28665 [Steroidobacteraceae bacterium]
MRTLARIPIVAWVGVLFFAGIASIAVSHNSSAVRTAVVPNPACIAQEPLTIAGIMRVYDTINRPSLTKWTINAGMGANYFVKLVDAITREPKVAYFARGGSSITTDIPVGAYSIRHASGGTWCGEQELFGPNTVLQEGTKTVTVDDEHTYTLYLTPQRNGNFPTKLIPRSEF